MSKIPKSVVVDEIVESDIWDWEHTDLQKTILADLGREFQDSMDRSWHWYVRVDRYKLQGWSHITINSDHKNLTVANWLTANNAEFYYEGQEFLIKESDVAIITALRWV